MRGALALLVRFESSPVTREGLEPSLFDGNCIGQQDAAVEKRLKCRQKAGFQQELAPIWASG
jgi:hypothetical protein